MPDRPRSLTDYERGPFRRLLNSDAPALFGRAQNLATPDQLMGKTGSRHNLAHSEGSEMVFRWRILLQSLAVL